MGRRYILISGLLALFVTGLFAYAMPMYAEHESDKPDVKLRATAPRTAANDETRFIVTVLDKDHRPMTGVPVSLLVEPAAMPAGHGSSQHQSERLTAPARPTDQPGEYAADLKLAAGGEWKVTVVHGQERTEFKASGNRDSIRIAASAHGSGGSEQQGQEKGHTAGSGGETGVHIERTIGRYAVALSMDEHARVGAESHMVMSITDGESGAPATGLSVEIIPVRLPEAEGGGHGEEKTAEAAHEASRVPALRAQESTTAPGRYEVEHAFAEPGPHLMLVRVGADQSELVAMPIEVEDTGGHKDESGGPNYWFVGTLLGAVGITIVMVAFLRQQERSRQPVRVKLS